MCVSGAIIGSAALGAFGSSRAADAQVEAAEAQARVQERIYEENTERFQPFYEGGQRAYNALLYELGLGQRPGAGSQNALTINEIEGTPGTGNRLRLRGNIKSDSGADVLLNGRVIASGVNDNAHMQTLRDQYGGTPGTPTRYQVGDQMFDSRDAAQSYIDNYGGGEEYQGFRATPGYQFRVNEGVNALDASAASGGGLFSGASAKALTEFGQNIGAQEYGNYINRLTGMASSGQNAAGQQAAAGQNFATGMSNAYGAMGNAQAAGAMGMANAVNSGVNNWLGYQMYSNLLGG